MGIYWLTRLNDIRNMLDLGGVAFFIALGGFFVFIFHAAITVDDCERNEHVRIIKAMRKFYINAFVLSIILFTVTKVSRAFIPTNNQMAAIIAAELVLEDERITTLSSKALRALHKYVDSYLDEPDQQK